MFHEPDKSADLHAQETQPPATDQADLPPETRQQAEIESLGNELAAMKDKYLRALADCQNIQKRSAAERTEAVQRGQAEMARALLSVLDDFERTLDAAEKSNQDAAGFAQGVHIIHQQMLKTLAEFGVVRMDLAKGDPFDPMCHQAVAQQPSDDVEPEHVLHVAQAGYMIKDRVLRPATVVVATRALPGPAEQ